MTTLYKLTDEHGRTYNGTQWGEGVSHSGTGWGELCGPGYIHAYEHPLIAAFMCSAHVTFLNPRLWEAEGEIALREGQLKCGCVTLTTLRELPLPVITLEQRVRIAMRCAEWVEATTRNIHATENARWAAAMAAQWARAAQQWGAETAAPAAEHAERWAAALAEKAGKDLPLLAIIQQILSEDSQP